MATPEEMRAQALELLKEAQSLDGKKPWTVALGGRNLDGPMAFVVWSVRKPTEAQACDATDTDADAVERGGIEMTIQGLPLNAVLPASVATPAATVRRAARP